MKEEKTVSFIVEEGLWKRFSEKCARLGKRKGEILRELIKRWVENDSQM